MEIMITYSNIYIRIANKFRTDITIIINIIHIIYIINSNRIYVFMYLNYYLNLKKIDLMKRKQRYVKNRKTNDGYKRGC